MKTATITWEDGQTSYESFHNEDELWDYINAIEEDTGVPMEDWETDTVSQLW